MLRVTRSNVVMTPAGKEKALENRLAARRIARVCPEDPEGFDAPDVDRIVRQLELGRLSSQRSSGSTAPPSFRPTAWPQRADLGRGLMGEH
jgi:hypothetical protein